MLLLVVKKPLLSNLIIFGGANGGPMALEAFNALRDPNRLDETGL